jgi:hypothetical protein
MVQQTLLSSRTAILLEKPCDSPSCSSDQLQTSCAKKLMVPGASLARTSSGSTAASESDGKQPPAVVNMRSGMLPCLGRQRTAILFLDDACCEVEGQISPAAYESDDQPPLAAVNMRSGVLPCLGRQRTAVLFLDDDCCGVEGQVGHGDIARQSLRRRVRARVAGVLRFA